MAESTFLHYVTIGGYRVRTSVWDSPANYLRWNPDTFAEFEDRKAQKRTARAQTRPVRWNWSVSRGKFTILVVNSPYFSQIMTFHNFKLCIQI